MRCAPLEPEHPCPTWSVERSVRVTCCRGDLPPGRLHVARPPESKRTDNTLFHTCAAHASCISADGDATWSSGLAISSCLSTGIDPTSHHDDASLNLPHTRPREYASDSPNTLHGITHRPCVCTASHRRVRAARGRGNTPGPAGALGTSDLPSPSKTRLVHLVESRHPEGSSTSIPPSVTGPTFDSPRPITPRRPANVHCIPASNRYPLPRNVMIDLPR